MSKSLLPPNASKLERDFSEVVARIGELHIPIDDLWNPETCPLGLLPYLAWALSVDVWDEDWPEDVKRAVVRESVAIHRIKGTPGAVEKMCAALGYDVRVLEWFEYGGDHDRYKLKIKERMSDADYQHIITGDRVAKRQSQERDAIQVKLESESTVYIGGVVNRGRRIAIYPHYKLSGAKSLISVGGGIRDARKRTIYPADGGPLTASSTFIYFGGVMHIARHRTLRSV
ncbi:phage tail protein I [Maridesulfovibrio hydrothermalis]|uniref:Phage tail protein I n=1 Tax=Maridesulfovibrio hydrothermalis AM13 = DSM 14728 TaxID=1121451 RepID=L0R6A3_9BACT|nr:phage tail protein I [Maridesulfovibrio hydrothermalis]CCO22224.1 protein of unknown function [Maridesulfovibrio hydrothermalis AM13 = DSM 14728]